MGLAYLVLIFGIPLAFLEELLYMPIYAFGAVFDRLFFWL